MASLSLWIDVCRGVKHRRGDNISRLAFRVESASVRYPNEARSVKAFISQDP